MYYYVLPKTKKHRTREEYDLWLACKWMIKNDQNLEKTAKRFGFSKTTLWRRMHKKLRKIDPILYNKVVDQMERNKLKFRGGNYWYGKC